MSGVTSERCLARKRVESSTRNYLASSKRQKMAHSLRTVDIKQLVVRTVFFYSPGGKALIKDPETLTGVVLNGAHGIYDVHTDIGVLRCTLRGKLKKAFAHAQSSKSLSKARPRSDLLLTLPRAQRIEQRNSSSNALPIRLSVGDYVKLRQLDGDTATPKRISAQGYRFNLQKNHSANHAC
jgi:hypothetical protein